MGLMNERATDQMGCAHPWPVLVDPHVRELVHIFLWMRKPETDRTNSVPWRLKR